MTLDELEAAIAERNKPYTYTPSNTGVTPPGKGLKTAIEIADDILAGRTGSFYTVGGSESVVEPQHGLQIIRREPQEMLPVSVVIVEDESTGCMQYMRRSADGHLGALDV
jgi:hypothetical protein